MPVLATTRHAGVQSVGCPALTRANPPPALFANAADWRRGLAPPSRHATGRCKIEDPAQPDLAYFLLAGVTYD